MYNISIINIYIRIHSAEKKRKYNPFELHLEVRKTNVLVENKKIQEEITTSRRNGKLRIQDANILGQSTSAYIRYHFFDGKLKG